MDERANFFSPAILGSFSLFDTLAILIGLWNAYGSSEMVTSDLALVAGERRWESVTWHDSLTPLHRCIPTFINDPTR